MSDIYPFFRPYANPFSKHRKYFPQSSADATFHINYWDGHIADLRAGSQINFFCHCRERKQTGQQNGGNYAYVLHGFISFIEKLDITTSRNDDKWLQLNPPSSTYHLSNQLLQHDYLIII